MASRMLPDFPDGSLDLTLTILVSELQGAAHWQDSSCPRGPWPWESGTWSELKWQSWEGGQETSSGFLVFAESFHPRLEKPKHQTGAPLPHFS